MHFLKLKIEAYNKVIHETLIRKRLCLSINEYSLSYSGPFEYNPLGGQKLSLH